MNEEKNWNWCCGPGKRGVSVFGIILVLFGLFLLAQDFGYIPETISGWTIILILLGLWFLLGSLKR